MLSYADVGYFSDPHNAKSHTGYLFTYCDIAISWRSQKQTLVATSNHVEVISLHEASKECRWLRFIRHIQETSGLPTDKNPTILFEDNATCVTQMKEGYIKSDKINHIPPKFFSFTQGFARNKEVDIQYVRSSDKCGESLHKGTPYIRFQEACTKYWNMSSLKSLKKNYMCLVEEELYSFFPY